MLAYAVLTCMFLFFRTRPAFEAQKSVSKPLRIPYVPSKQRTHLLRKHRKSRIETPKV